ncbi:hypothetical protein [Paraburkholderia gardini]|uniref:Uncharacterized protein n=1 Tax=Paraburkholderia gardini TaxID=2823469 RepID=A0ABN7QQR8_9BURK|nr:hypothetical protein [Paraburkholderia gardini]CAG4920385.1 hypothetical protein R54767_04709 [Paraburkholderia gardini]CAG4924779.1 hypothetical protein R69919_05240 [Paraburkholderia gardini]
MPNVTTNAPFPPTGSQIAVVIPNVVGGVLQNPGTLTGVVVSQPIAVKTGSAPIDISFYDSVGTPAANATPIATIKADQGYQPVPLNVQFTTGLYAVQRSQSSVAVSFE